MRKAGQIANKKMRGNPAFASKWKDEFYIDAYRAARSGKGNSEVAAVLGCGERTFTNWVKERPALRYALNAARNPDKGTTWTLKDYIYDRLPTRLKEYWDKISEFEKAPDGVTRVEAMLRDEGKDVRQALFFHAMIQHSFNPSEACRSVGITRYILKDWIENDPNFADLLDEFHWHRKNFYESKLHDLISVGETQAVIFANKTLNADRGYGEKVRHEHSGQVTQEVNITVDMLGLPPDVMRIVLDAYREAKKRIEEAPKAARPAVRLLSHEPS
jgi:hypothetical protein